MLEIRVTPNAGKSELIKTEAGIKARLASPPVDGKANDELIRLLSKELKIAKSNIEIIKGETSRNKTVLFKIEKIY